MNHSFCVGRERRNPDVGQVAIPEGSSGVFSVGSVFSLLRAGFSPRLSVDNRLDPNQKFGPYSILVTEN